MERIEKIEDIVSRALGDMCLASGENVGLREYASSVALLVSELPLSTDLASLYDQLSEIGI